MLPEELIGKTVALVGFGRAGQAMARYLCAAGAAVLVSDRRPYGDLAPAEQDLLADCSARFEGGGHTAEFLAAAELIVLSPGVDGRHPLFAELRRRIPVVGELAVAAGRLNGPVIAVTGTNGKTTVVELIGALLRDAGQSVFVGGNIGTPIGDCLLADEPFDCIVLEVSSFQLESCGAFSPQVGVLLNVSPDHLDRHRTLAEYGAAKMKIFQGESDYAAKVINADDPVCRRLAADSGQHDFAFFGHRPDCAAVVDEAGVSVGGHRFDLATTALGTRSGLLNAAAALLAVRPFVIEPASLELTLHRFRTGDHRLRRVGEIDGVRFVNDSKATNTGAVINGILEVGGPVILIAGGRDKGDDYALLRDAVADRVKRLVLIGEAAGALGAALGDLVPADYAATLEEAVRRAAAAAEPGDTVLLSPACASFDMFPDYRARGERFVELVRAMAERAQAEVEL